MRTIDEARRQVPELVVDLLKTVAFERVPGTQRVLAAVPARCGVDYRALAQALGCSRRALRLLPPARVEAELGFEIGGVGPWPVTADVVVVLDAALGDDARVRCGGGTCTRTVELRAGDLARVSGALRAPIAVDDTGDTAQAGPGG